MPSLRDFVGQELTWVRPRLFQNAYELRANDQCLATLNRSGFFKQVSLGEAEGQQWRFKREGFWNVSLVIYPGANGASTELGQPLASIKRKWNGQGELIFSDGHTYTWSHTKTGFLSTAWSWSTPTGSILSMKKSRKLEIAPMARNLPDLPLLVLFALFMILVKEDEEEAAASASASTGG